MEVQKKRRTAAEPSFNPSRNRPPTRRNPPGALAPIPIQKYWAPKPQAGKNACATPTKLRAKPTLLLHLPLKRGGLEPIFFFLFIFSGEVRPIHHLQKPGLQNPIRAPNHHSPVYSSKARGLLALLEAIHHPPPKYENINSLLAVQRPGVYDGTRD